MPTFKSSLDAEIFYKIDDHTDPDRESQTIVFIHGFCESTDVEFNRKLIKKGPNVQLKIDHVLNPTCLVIRQEAQGDHNGHDWQGQEA